MVLIDTLERTDIPRVDGFGVREACRRLKGLEKVSPPRQVRERGLAWSPAGRLQPGTYGGFRHEDDEPDFNGKKRISCN